ncbi:MAG: galactose oxidase [Bacteroidota bacterium]
MKTKYKVFLLLSLFFISLQDSFSQSYGLGFYSHEVVQDKRTGLDLSPGKTLCFNGGFELSFDLNFIPKRDDYFGYIVRLVVNDEENIDLIYDKDTKEKNHFKIIVGDQFTKIAFDIPRTALFNTWNTIKMKFDYERNELLLSYGKFSQRTQISFKKGNCFKILFGANEYQRFKTSDNPPMKIRNIGIDENGKQKYFWPLDEYDGNLVPEKLHQNNATVNKPLWIKKLHYQWQLLHGFVVNGAASVAFDALNESVKIIARDSLKTFSINDNKLLAIAYQNKLTLLRGNHSLYDDQGKLLNFYTDQKKVSIFNSLTQKWTKDYNPNTPITDFWQFNKFYAPLDSSLYVLGGYGHFVYKNQIQKYHFPSNTWTSLKVSGDAFTPRYLAGLGFDGKGAYIIGGYGSSTGKQMLNPRNLYDLLYFDVRKKSIRKIYELKVEGEDFVFANSLIINEKNKTFYGLVFPQHKYNASLQLIEGSLTKPEYKFQGSKIPFQFHDINSFADLFYSAISKKFIAVTTFRDSTDRTHVKIYALNAPPLAVPVQQLGNSQLGWYLAGLAATLVIAIGFLWYWRKEKTLKTIAPAILKDELPVTSEPKESVTKPKATAIKNGIFLFGNFQLFDKDGNDATKFCTPLVRELFLLVLLYTIRGESGISSEKLNEILWFDKSEKDARNNRSVNIAKLRSILEKTEGCQVSKETGYWKIEIDNNLVYIDYQQYLAILKDKQSDKEKVIKLIAIVHRGGLLLNTDYPWLDDFKSEVSNEMLDLFLNVANALDHSTEPEFMIQVTNGVLDFDSVNEEAMILKCKSLALLGRHTLAKSTFEKFIKEYQLIYGEDFDKSFRTIMN